MSGEEREKTVTIRGVDRELYSRALALAREVGKSAGEMINEALRLLLSHTMAAATAITRAAEAGREIMQGVKEVASAERVVSGVGELVVRRADLEAVEKPVVFRGIKRLVFDEDVDYELFNSKVRAIVMCDEVQVPKAYPKLKVAERCRMVGKLVEKP
ncbi:hypothetical protein B6U99_07880 [Candidatus Geothermarchaeota archaeon ex4572_27]|nr:MAG: hypothetical protein B6U99_07880 [Candidatus Geothermarchaeota archaeon ex4572_27]